MKAAIYAAIVAVTIAGNCYAGVPCREIEYAELKDMSVSELQQEFAKDKDLAEWAYKQFMESDSMTRRGSEYLRDVGKCKEQSSRIEKVIKSRADESLNQTPR